MTELKREYVVPLRRKTKYAPKWRRSKKAVSVLKDFIRKHMKTDNVILCSELNESIWANGIKNPPGKVSVIALKTQINGVEKVLVNLADKGIESQLEIYKTQAPQMPQTKEKEKTSKKEVKDIEAKEVETPKKEEKKETVKETDKKKEVKKNE